MAWPGLAWLNLARLGLAWPALACGGGTRKTPNKPNGRRLASTRNLPISQNCKFDSIHLAIPRAKSNRASLINFEERHTRRRRPARRSKPAEPSSLRPTEDETTLHVAGRPAMKINWCLSNHFARLRSCKVARATPATDEFLPGGARNSADFRADFLPATATSGGGGAGGVRC